MTNTDYTATDAKLHHGRNIRRLRDILGVKQSVIASQLGITQQNVSRMEQKESIDKETLGKIAKALNVQIETIENFSEESPMCNIETFNNKDQAINNFMYYNNNNNYFYNHIETIKELYQNIIDIKDGQLKEKDIELKTLREKIVLLEDVINKK